MPRKQIPTTSINSLSPEVLDLILETICNAQNQHEAVIIENLTTCRLLSRLFNCLTAPRVFKKVHLHCFGWMYRENSKGDAAAERHSVKFLLLLHANPAIATYVRDIEMTSRLGERSWLRTSKSLPQILPKLVNVQRLSIDVYNGILLWQKLHTDVAKAFQDVFQMSGIRTLEVLNVSGLPLDPLIVVVPQKKQLATTGTTGSCHSTRIKAMNSADASSATNLGYVSQSSGLEYLVLCVGTLQHCSLTLDTSVDGKKQQVYTIKKLKVSFKTEHSYLGNFPVLEKPWERLATRLGGSLKQLELSDMNERHRQDQWPSGDKLSALTCLETLTLFANIYPVAYNINFPSGLARALQVQKPTATIQTIRLIFSLSVWIMTFPTWCLTEGWDALAGMLSSIAPNLETLILQFQMGNFIQGGCPKSTKTLEDAKKHFRDVLSSVKTAFPTSTVRVLIIRQCDFTI